MKLEQVLLQGIRADQPAATDVGAGTLYCVTDEGFIIEQSDGAAWSPYSPAVVSPGITQLTGDVTAGPGSGSVAATIAANAVTNTKLRDSGALSVIGRSANSTGDPADIAASAASAAVLRESGSVLGFGTIATAGIADAAVTYAKIQDVSAISKLLGRGSGAGAGDVEEITLGTNLSMSGTTLNATDTDTGINQLTGDVTAGPGNGSQAATIGNDKVVTAKILNSNVTLAKIVDVSAASRLIGRGSASGSGVQQEITLGTGLSMSGTALSATGAGSVSLNEVVGVLDINNTAAETAFYTKSIPGGTIGSTGFLRLQVVGGYLNNTGSPRFITIKIKYGSTTLYDSATGNIAASANRYPYLINVTIGNLGATNSQFAWLEFGLSNITAASSGIGSLNVSPLIATRWGTGVSAEDSTTTLTFQVTVTCSGSAQVTQSFLREYASLELLNA